jgi:hypothetical protein
VLLEHPRSDMCNANRSLATAFLAYALFGSSGFCQTTGSIAGTLTGDDGKTLAAVVTARQTTAPAATFRVEAAANGAFTIANLPVGSYALCAAVEQLGYVDPCEWSLQPVAVQLAAGQAATGVKFVVKKGGLVGAIRNEHADGAGRRCG